MIPYGRQDISQEDINAVVAVLKSDYLTQGPAVPKFEQTVSNYCDARFAVAVNSATSALHIACLALGVGKGDVVWTSPITFVASANCALYCGATIDFVDIDPQTYNMCAEHLAEKLAAAEKIGKLPKVVIPVHLSGQSCEMERIYKLGQQYGFKILEDASHAIGGRYKGQSIGNCQFSDIAVFSFHPVKIVTTGEGGMAVTNDEFLAKRMRLLRSHGISGALEDMDARSPNEIWNYQQISLGFNYRMTDIQAALGDSQMARLDEFVSKRNMIASRYDSYLHELNVKCPFQNANSYSSYHLYVIRLNLRKNNITQKEIYQAFHKSGVLVNLHYIPVYRQPYFEKLGFTKNYCPAAEQYFLEALSLPIFPTLTEVQQDRVVGVLREMKNT
jgi:UDP-4-amino-4,6-dideoxy-N-acetyl-beta-L-altrosamine transaminase